MNDAGVWLLSTRHIQPRGAGEFDVDTVVRTTAGLRFAARHCIYDSEMIPNAIIYPL
jgi:hypothetical protein